ncbi:MAG: radical SAM protein [Halodesulfurarchaeum sp.]
MPANVVVRSEHFGYLLWSRPLDTYLYPTAEWIHDEIEKLVASPEYQRDSIAPQLESELSAIGLWDGYRVVENALEGRLGAPLDVYFDYTYACNLDCPFCYNKEHIDTPGNAATMSESRVRRVLQNMAKNGIMRTHLAGGDPLIDPSGLDNYLSTATELGINSSIVTNGTMFDERRREILFDNDLVTLTFSIDSPIPERHDELRGEGVFDQVTDAARRAVAYRDRINSDTRVQIKMTWPPTIPLRRFDQMAQLGAELGVDVVQFHNPERSTDHETGHYRDHAEEYYERIRYLDDLQNEYEDIDIWNVWNPIAGCRSIGLPNMRGCIGGQELLGINPDGRLTPCLMNDHTLGDLFAEWDGSIGDFWRESTALDRFQSTVRDLPETCETCDLLAECRGGSVTRKIVGSDAGGAEPTLDHMHGTGSYCLRDGDYYEEAIQAVESTTQSPFQHFDEVHVAHSL